MSSRRIAKVAEAIRESVSSAILFELRDPRVRNVAVIRAEVTSDLRSAKVYVSIRGDEKLQSLSLHGLNSARGFLQAKVADRLQTRYTPILQFVHDPALQVTDQTSALLREAMARTAETRVEAPPETETPNEEHADLDMNVTHADEASAPDNPADGCFPADDSHTRATGSYPNTSIGAEVAETFEDEGAGSDEGEPPDIRPEA